MRLEDITSPPLIYDILARSLAMEITNGLSSDIYTFYSPSCYNLSVVSSPL